MNDPFKLLILADTMDLFGLLRARRNRTHGRRATNQRDEISSLHEPP